MRSQMLIRQALVVCFALLAQAPTRAAEETKTVTENEASPAWPGMHVLQGRRAYADTPMGQVHYSVLGEGTPLVLLHQTPWFSVQYAKAQPLLAKAGIEAIAVDTPGFGMSQLPDHAPTAEEYADNLAAFLDAVGLRQVGILGHHTGATIGAAFASRHPARVSCVILHGVPLYTAEERGDRLKNQLHPDTSIATDGSHFTNRWRTVNERVLKNTATPESQHWSGLAFYIAGSREWYGHQAAFTFDMEKAIKGIKAPTLIMSNTADSIHHTAARALKLRPEFKYHEFAGGNSHMMYDDPEPWSAAVAAFVTTTCKPQR